MPPSRISEESRLAVLRLSALLDTPAEEAFDRLTRLAARATGAPVAAVTLLDETRQLFKSAVGLAGPAAARREVPRADSLCDHVVRTGEALVAGDTRAHPATRGRAGVRTLGWAAYLGVPLTTPDGAVLGAFCLADHRPREWSEGEVETARDLAAAVVTEIELRREAREAAAALAGLREAREALERREQFYRALLENASDVVDVVDPDGTIRYVTPSVERLLGYSPAEMVGTVSTAYLAEPPAPVEERLAGRAATPGRGEPVLLRLKARDGAVRVFEAQTTNLMEHPAVRGLVVNARDVTERRRTEEALRLRDRALDAAPQGVIITGPAEADFPILYANPGFLRLTGYAEEEVLGRNCRFLSGPATHPETVEAMRAALAEGRDCSVELVNHRRDGTPFWNSVSFSPVRDERGRITHFVGVQADVTERRRAEAELRESEERFRLLVDAVRDHAIFLLDPDGLVASWNAGAERVLGYPAEEVLGRPASIFYPAGGGREELPARDLREAVEEGRSEHDAWWVRRGGEVAWMNTVVSPMRDDAGRLVGFAAIARDLTERRAAEEALRRSEARLSGIVSSAMDAILSVDEGGRIIVFNGAAEAMFGCPAAQALGQSMERFIPARFRAAHREHVRGFGAGGVTSRTMSRPGTLTALRADGAEFPIEATISQVEAGGEKVFTVIVRDVTERRRAERELARVMERELRAGERLTNILESVTDAFFALDHKGRFTYLNPRSEALTGRPRDELLGKVAWDALAFPAESRFETELRRALAGGGAVHFEGYFAPLERWLEVRAFPGLDGLSVYAQDVTERKEAEEALRISEALLRSVVEGISDAIFLKDLDGRYRLVNSAGARNAGLTPEDFAGRTDRELFPAIADEVERVERRVLETGETESYERTYERGGKTRVYLMTRSPFRGLDGRMAGILGMAHDVTERRLLEEQLRQSQKMEAVGRLAGGVAHDFNNLLMAIGGHAQLLLRRIDGESPLRRSLEEIHRATGRAAALTQQLLAFSRQQVLQPRVVEPGAVVRELRPMLERLIGEDVELVIRDGARGRVRADPAQLEQVLLNLAVNARDAMPLGGVLVVETSDAVLGPADAERYRYVTPGRFVLLTVTDTGEGMDEATRERAFEPFFTTKPPGKGTGLGLATVYGVVKQSGGYVWIESTPGKATTFRIYLPRVDGPAAASPLAPAAPAAAPAAPAASGTVLLVEDDDAVRALAAEALEAGGFRVLSAPDGPAALALAAHAAVDLLLTDVVMPGMAGPELARRLRERRPALAVLFMSGYPGEEVLRRGTSVEGAGFVQKPVDPAELVRRAAEAVEARRRGEG